MPQQTKRLIVGFLLLFGFFARASSYKAPLLDHQAWRQADTASIARNFYRERFNIFYPQVDERGGQANGYVETGLELFAFLVAGIAKLTGFHPEIGRLLSALLFVPSELLVWTFVRRRYGSRPAIVAAFLYAFGFPLQLFIEQAFMNEALLVCLSLVCLVAAQRYLASGKHRYLAVLVAASALIGAVKLPYLIVWAPVAGLFLEARRARGALSWELGVMMAVDLLIAGAWYRHAHQLALVTGLSFGLFDKLFDPGLVFSFDFISTIGGRLFKDVLGPIGFIGVLAGLRVAARERRWCELFGFGGFVAYLLLVARGNYVHDYYQLAVMPVAPALASLGLVRVTDSMTAVGRQRRTTLAIAMAVAASSTFIRLASAHSWYEYPDGEAALCRSVNETTGVSERVVIVGNNDPRFLFCLDRKGWLLSPSESDQAHVRAARDGGATIVILLAAAQDLDLRRFLAESGSSILRTPQLEVVRFTQQSR